MKDQKGTSLVSVIVSFAVMMIVLLLLQVSIMASGRYAARADSVWKRAAEADRKYVDDDPDAEPKEVEKRSEVGLAMATEAGSTEFWGRMEKWRTTAKDPEDFQIYYVKHP